MLVSESNLRRGEALASQFRPDVEVVSDASGYAGEVRPWGWSLPLVGELARNGINRSSLPALPELKKLRELSHRRTSVRLAESMGFGHWMRYAEDEESALEAIEKFDGKAFVKLPWSCSGRGVFDTRSIPRSKVREVVGAAIRRQGGVTVELAHDKKKDFAILYEYRVGCARCLGLSMFEAATSGFYGGNAVLPQEEIATAIGWDTASLAAKAGEALERVLGNAYDGPAGVDMLVAAGPAGKYVVPCVEVNLRYTMGFVAAGIHRHSGLTGRLALVDGKFVLLRSDGAEQTL